MEKTQIVKYLQHPGSLNAETLEITKSLTDEFPWFQAGWMLYLKNLQVVDSPDFDFVLKKVAILVPDRKQLYKYLNNEIQFSPVRMLQPGNTYSLGDDEAVQEKGNALIDRFLNTTKGKSNKITSSDETTKSAGNQKILEDSTAENNDMITETLANLYFEQKNYEKALEAYKILSLKYPEKNIYFASRISEIEILIAK